MDRHQAYRLALTAELRSQALYRKLGKGFAASDAAEIFATLVGMEKAHEAKLQEAYRNENNGQPLLLIDDFDPELADLDFTDPVKVLDFAIAREEQARQNYLDLAGDTGDPSLKEVFERFAQEEAGHATVLLALIQKLQGALTWYDPSELTGLMED